MLRMGFEKSIGTYQRNRRREEKTDLWYVEVNRWFEEIIRKWEKVNFYCIWLNVIIIW